MGARSRWPLGMNLMLWTDVPDAGPATRALLARLAAFGYGGIEVPLLDLDGARPGALAAVCDDLGLWRTANTALPAGSSLLEVDHQPAALAWLERVCAAAATLGAPIVCGPICAPVGALPGRPTARQWAACVEGLRRAGELAERSGVILALEPINRYESCIANTVADARRLVLAAGSPGLRLMADTFHMHIEERDPAAALRSAADVLVHVHASENDRGPCGAGQIAWPRLLAALRDAGYTGRLVVESFGGEIPAIARACCVWRDLAPSADELAGDSARFLGQAMVAAFAGDGEESTARRTGEREREYHG